MSAQPSTPRNPYASFEDYWAAGWRGLLPLPHGRKAPVPTGYTGNAGTYPSFADCMTWAEDTPHNIALRLPDGVIGVDVDAYGSKIGGFVLAELEKQLGALPATWRSTSRDDGISGIRLYRVPAGLAWPNEFGPGIESIRHAHRYVVAPPSIHPDTQQPYRWINPDGITTLAVPRVDDLPALPDAWVQHFTQGRAASAGDASAGLKRNEVTTWLTQRSTPGICRGMEAALDKHQPRNLSAGSRHDAYTRWSNAVIFMAAEGHKGLDSVLDMMRKDFHKAIGADRSPSDVDAEFDRMIAGSVDKAAAKHPGQPAGDPCDDPFHGLTTKETLSWTNPAPITTPATPAGDVAIPGQLAAPEASDASSASLPAPTATEPANSEQTEQAQPERSTWWPIDLTGVVTGDRPKIRPAHLKRTDGAPAFYPSRVNGIIGPSESGKSWIALVGVAQTINDGKNATILDFEDDENGVVGRLLALGCSGEDILAHLSYVAPTEALTQFTTSLADLVEHLDSTKPEFILFDGFNASMGLQGLDLMSNGDVTKFFQQVLTPLAKRGAAVVYVDHTPKNSTDSAGGIGAQAKRAMTSGCTLKADLVKPFGIGQEGKIRLYVDKDRPAGVRGNSAQSKSGHWFADVIVASRGEDDVTVELRAPEGMDANGHVNFRPTVLMQRISDFIQANPGAGRNEILREVRGKAEALRDALGLLIDEGWVRTERDGQHKLHYSTVAFSELVTPPGSRGPTEVPLGSGTPVDMGQSNWGPTEVPLGSRDPGKGNWGPEVPPGYVVPGGRDPGAYVERTVEGRRVRVDLSTGEVVPG